MGNASYRSPGRISGIFCFTVSFLFLIATAVCLLVLIGSLAAFPALVFFAVLAMASAYAGSSFLAQCEPMGFSRKP